MLWARPRRAFATPSRLMQERGTNQPLPMMHLRPADAAPIGKLDVLVLSPALWRGTGRCVRLR